MNCKFIIVIILAIMGLHFLKSREDFSVNQLLNYEMQSNKEYSKCIDHDAKLKMQSSGEYPNCHRAMKELNEWGFTGDDDVGYGKMDLICPVSCLKAQPSDCLKAKLKNQEQIFKKINDELRDYKAQNNFRFKYNARELEDHQNHMNELYGRPYVSSFMKYMEDSGKGGSVPGFNRILETHENSVAKAEINKALSTPLTQTTAPTPFITVVPTPKPEYSTDDVNPQLSALDIF